MWLILFTGSAGFTSSKSNRRSNFLYVSPSSTPTKTSQGGCYLDKDLVKLDESYRFPKTPKSAIAKDEIEHLLHLLHLVRVVIEPALRTENLRVLAEDGNSLHSPRAIGDLGATGYETAFNHITLRRHFFLQPGGDGRPDAQAFFDAGLEVGEGFRFGVGDGAGYLVVGFGAEDLRGKFGVDARDADYMEHCGADGCGGGVRPGESFR